MYLGVVLMYYEKDLAVREALYVEKGELRPGSNASQGRHPLNLPRWTQSQLLALIADRPFSLCACRILDTHFLRRYYFLSVARFARLATAVMRIRFTSCVKEASLNRPWLSAWLPKEMYSCFCIFRGCGCGPECLFLYDLLRREGLHGAKVVAASYSFRPAGGKVSKASVSHAVCAVCVLTNAQQNADAAKSRTRLIVLVARYRWSSTASLTSF